VELSREGNIREWCGKQLAGAGPINPAIMGRTFVSWASASSRRAGARGLRTLPRSEGRPEELGSHRSDADHGQAASTRSRICERLRPDSSRDASCIAAPRPR